MEKSKSKKDTVQGDSFYKQDHHDITPRRVVLPVKVAVMIDGGFFMKRYNAIYNKDNSKTASNVVNDLYTIAHAHVGQENYLYRIFYYDCPPFTKKVHNPVSRKCINFDQSPQALFRREVLELLKQKRKVALRLGYLKDSGNWAIHPRKVKDLLSGTIAVKDLKEEDVKYELRQKCIDIKIGVDIATLSLKRLVDRIVLISGDSDFVPASKLARREGIDFILNPMGLNHVDPSLFEHIDGLYNPKLPLKPSGL